jgi:hypothetical protein
LNGNLLFLDKNGSLTETPTNADRRSTGKSNVPVYTGGFGFNTSYKGFFLDAQFSYAFDVWRFDGDLDRLSTPLSWVGITPITADHLDAWSPTNVNGSFPSLTATNVAAGTTFSDRFLKDASYIRMKNVSFGYQVPSSNFKNSFISSLRIYSQFENLLTWSKWKGYDPEGYFTRGAFPTPKIISFGVDVQF